MVLQTLSEVGPWAWFILGLVLLVGEVLIPGVFLIWFGLSAVIIGTLTLVSFTDVAWWPWQAQLVAFGVLSLVLVMMANRLFPTDTDKDEASKINDPLARFLGREAPVVEAIENGMGKVKLGDTVWRVRGSDLPVGAKVRVTGADDGILLVEAA